MYSNLNYLVAMQIQKDRQQEIINQLRLDELLSAQRNARGERLQRLLGLLRPVVMMKVVVRRVSQVVAHGV